MADKERTLLGLTHYQFEVLGVLHFARPGRVVHPQAVVGKGLIGRCIWPGAYSESILYEHMLDQILGQLAEVKLAYYFENDFGSKGWKATVTGLREYRGTKEILSNPWGPC